MLELDRLDRKILYELDKNSRQPASALARKLRVHKNVVNFRINRLIDRRIIRQFVAMIRPSVLGLSAYKFYFQFQDFTSKKEKKFLEFIKTLPVYWAAKVSGNWDFVLGLMAQDLMELNQIKKKILEKFGKDIVRKTFSVLVEAPHYYRNYLHEGKVGKVRYWMRDEERGKLDGKDKKILKILGKNARTPIVEIADKTGLNVKTCISKIRKLEKIGAIYDYRISLNLENIGLKFFKCFITLKDGDEKRLRDLFAHFHKQRNIVHVVECVGDWDLEPELEIESFEKFQEEVDLMRDNFSDLIKSIETINIIKEYSYACVP